MATLEITRLDRIMSSATELFKSKGYIGTSMRDIAEVVGLEASSLYSHVQSKDELLQNICYSIASKFQEHINRVINIPNCTGKELLEMAIDGHVQIITEDINATSVFWNEWKYLKDPYHTELSRMQLDYEHKFKSILDQGVESKEFCINDTLFATMTILSSLNGLQRWRSYSMPPEDLGGAFSELFIKGIKQ